MSSDNGDYKASMYKSESTTLVLAILLGFFGLNGVGHIYVGKAGLGIALLIVSIILSVTAISFMFSIIGLGIGIVLLIIYLAIFIWQIINAHNLCKEYNEHVRRTGQRPW